MATLRLEDLSLKEQTAVTALKSRMAGYMDNEMFEDVSVFIRFLRARDLNLNAAEAMLRNHIEWRKTYQLDTMLTDYVPKEVCTKYVTMNTLGVDKEGSPILYFNIGGIDSRGILKSCRKIDVIKCVIQKLESYIAMLKEESHTRGKYIQKLTMILNFENLSLSVATHKQALEVLGSLIVLYESNYPERLKVAYFINASIYFTMGFSVVKHFLSGPTYRKIKIFGKEGWKEDILNVIHANVLPEFLGGQRTDPDGDPLCKSVITHGGFVHESYFKLKKEHTLANDPTAEKLTVTRKSKAQVSVSITESGSHMEWQFETKSRDIGFSLLYKKNNLECKTKELIPKQRIDTDIYSETGMYKCDVPGIYIIEFDNSYSWIFQKEIFYKVTVVRSSLIQ